MRQRDIPKVFRVPRPMAQPGRRPRHLWEAVPAEAVALVLGVLLVLVLPLPLAGPNRALTAAMLRWVASAEPPDSVVAVTLSAGDLREGGCRERLEDVLRRAGARRALVVPPATELCGSAEEAEGEAEHGQVHAEGLWTELVPGSFRSDGAGVVFGFEGSGRSRALAERLGVSEAEWIAARPAVSVPTLRFHDLASGRVPGSALAHRVAVVGIESATWEGLVQESEVSALRQIAAGLGAALDDGPRRSAPPWLAAVLTLALGTLLVFVHARRGVPGALGALIGGWTFTFAGNVAYAGLGGPWLLPFASLAVGLGTCFVGVLTPHGMSAWRAVRRATELMERAVLLRTQSVHTIPAAEFWVRAASLAAQAHPCDGVLIAELPPHRWHLRFWPNGTMGENLVAERRRDIRRAPYCDENGVPSIRLVHGFLAMKGVPALVVPLIAFGDVEGYVFLCGTRAASAYIERPELAERLGHDLGVLLRRRRLGSLREDDWRRTAGSLVRPTELRTATLLEGARVALDDVRLFGTVIREAPVGLLYADSFADVRLVSKSCARWLAMMGISLPAASDGPLAAGQLGLGRILEAATGDTSFGVAQIADGDKPVARRIEVKNEEGVSYDLELSVQKLMAEAEGEKSLVGYVATIVEVEEQHTGVHSLAQRVAPPREGLGVVPAAELLSKAGSAAARATGRPVRIETPRFAANVIAQGSVLAGALEVFLTDAAERCPPGRGPVLAIQERRHHVQIDIMDLALGIPEGAFKRTVKAPEAAPPPGLESFARLVAAALDSHGSVLVQGGEGWGVQVSVRLLRAKTPLRDPEPERTGDVVDIATYTRKSGA